MDPALSVHSSKDVFGNHFGDIKKLRPFHESMKWCHQIRSLMKESVRVTVVSKEVIDVDRSIILRRKVLPGGTTLAANEKRPMRERRSCFVTTDFASQEERDSLICASLSGGRWALRRSVSRSIPRNGSRVAGPSSLSSAMGMFSTLNSHLITVRFYEHSPVLGAPKVRKSSR